MDPMRYATGSTPFGARCCGSTGRPHYWTGHIHKGRDSGAPTGTEVFAVWDGTVVAANWGAAFGTHIIIDTDRLPDGSPGLWVGYMHLSAKRVVIGQRVKTGQPIGRVGSTGNVSGPHLHLEVQRALRWSPTGYVDPAPWIAAGTGGRFRQDCKVFSSKMVHGQLDSDSVRNIQVALNARNVPDPMLPITGNYLDLTREAVATFQRAQGWTGADADGIVSKGTAVRLGLIWVQEGA